MSKSRRVVVMGATPKEDRYACIAMRRLLAHGFQAVPVNPAFSEVLGVPCHRVISEVAQPIDTITLYLRAERSRPLIDDILAANPKRIIFNPGAENEELARRASEAGVEVVHGCTLVMLSDGTF